MVKAATEADGAFEASRGERVGGNDGQQSDLSDRMGGLGVLKVQEEARNYIGNFAKRPRITQNHKDSQKLTMESVFLGFGVVSAQLQGRFEPAPSPNPRQNAKILASHISSNARVRATAGEGDEVQQVATYCNRCGKLGSADAAAGEDGGAGDAGVVAEFGGFDLDAFHGAGHDVFFGGFDDGGHHLGFEGFDDAAADDDDLGVEDVDEVGDADAGGFGGLFDDLFDEFVAFANGFAEIAAAHVGEAGPEGIGEDGFLAVFHGGLDLAKDGGAAGEGFKAAAIAAAAFGAVDFDDHVANLAGSEVVADVEVAVDDDAAADAGADEDADEVLGLGFVFAVEGAEGADVAVVADEDGDGEAFLQLFLKRDVFPPGKVGGEDDFAGIGIDGAGRADADGADVLHGEVAFIDGVVDAAGNAVDDGFDAAIGFGAELGGAFEVELVVEDAGENFRAAEVYAEEKIFAVVWHKNQLVNLLAGEHRLDFGAELGVDGIHGAMRIDDVKAVGALQCLEGAEHEGLVFEEGIEHVAREADVHAAFPVIEAGIFGEGALDEFFGSDVEIEDGVGHERHAVKALEPFLIHAADDVAGHQGVDVAIGEDHLAGAQCGEDNILQLIGEVGRVKQTERSATENVAFLGAVEFFADERGAFEADLDGGVATVLQPVDEELDLRGTSGAVRAFDDDKFAGELFSFDAGNAQAVEAALGFVGDDDFGVARGTRGLAVGFGAFEAVGAHFITGAFCAAYPGRSMRLATRERTMFCCASMDWLASMTVKLNSVLIARYCSRIRP